MSGADNRTTERIRDDIEAEREELVRSVESLRASLRETTEALARLRARLPLIAGSALAAGLVVAAAVKALRRRRRERD